MFDVEKSNQVEPLILDVKLKATGNVASLSQCTWGKNKKVILICSFRNETTD